MSPAVSGGASATFAFRSKGISIGGDVRGGGLGSNEDKLGFASAHAIVRYHFSDADIAPFVGGGLGFSYLQANRHEAGIPGGESPAGSRTESPSGSGLSAHLETGIELLRSSRFGAFASVRADAPFYVLEGTVHERGPDASFYDGSTVCTTTGGGPERCRPNWPVREEARNALDRMAEVRRRSSAPGHLE